MRLVISKSGGVTSNQEETAWSLDDGEQNVRVADWKSAIRQVGNLRDIKWFATCEGLAGLVCDDHLTNS